MHTRCCNGSGGQNNVVVDSISVRLLDGALTVPPVFSGHLESRPHCSSLFSCLAVLATNCKRSVLRIASKDMSESKPIDEAVLRTGRDECYTVSVLLHQSRAI